MEIRDWRSAGGAVITPSAILLGEWLIHSLCDGIRVKENSARRTKIQILSMAVETRRGASLVYDE